jgi:hypothetical protein
MQHSRDYNGHGFDLPEKVNKVLSGSEFLFSLPAWSGYCHVEEFLSYF